MGNTGTATASVTNIDKVAPTATISYNITGLTNQDVVATLTNASETITGTTSYTFTGNGSYTFIFKDLAGNSAVATGVVTWIDKTPVVGAISYSTTGLTNGNVTATVTFNKTGVTVTNNGGATGYVFTNTGSFTFSFQDAYGNTGST